MTERREETLILKRDPNARHTESYNVLFEGRYVGRIYKAISHAPREAPWFWGLEFHGQRWTAVRSGCESGSCKTGVPRGLGSEAEDGRI